MIRLSKQQIIWLKNIYWYYEELNDYDEKTKITKPN